VSGETNLSGDDNYAMVDGVPVKVSGDPAGRGPAEPVQFVDF
jgi:hypothetical protein